MQWERQSHAQLQSQIFLKFKKKISYTLLMSKNCHTYLPLFIIIIN